MDAFFSMLVVLASIPGSPEDEALRKVVTLLIPAAEKTVDVEKRGYALQHAATIQHRLGDRAEALATWQKATLAGEVVPIDKMRYPSHVLSLIAASQIDAGEMTAAGENLRKLLVMSRASSNEFHRGTLLLGIANEFQRAGDAVAADLVRVQAKDQISKIDDPFFEVISPRPSPQEKSLEAKLHAIDLRGLLSTLIDAEPAVDQDAEDFRSRWLGKLAESAGADDQETLAQALDLARRLKDGSRRNSTLPFFADAYLKLGKRKEAFQIAMEIDPSKEPDEQDGRSMRLRTLLGIAGASNQAGDHASKVRAMHAAEVDVQAFTDDYAKNQASQSLISQWIDMEDYAEAREAVRMSPEPARVSLLTELGMALERTGKLQEAKDAFREAYRRAEAPPKQEANAKGVAAPPPGDDPTAETRKRQDHEASRQETLADLQIHLGETKAALARIDALPDTPDKGARILRTSYLLASVGKADAGLAWATTLDDPDARIEALLGLSDGLIQRAGTVK